MKKLLLVIVLTCFTSLALADVVQLKKDHPQSYVVKKGDTLWDISQMFLDSPWKWPDIWHLNQAIDNPNLIYPGDTLALVNINGQEKVTVEERGPVKVSPQTIDSTKLLPEVRTSVIQSAIPAIPLEKINAFLSKNRVVNSASELKDSPYVLSGSDRHLLTGAGDVLYARGAFNKDDGVFNIYREGDAYVDPDTKEVLGIEARYIASVRMTALDGDVGTFVVNASAEEIRIGDHLLRKENADVLSSFTPQSPKQKIRGLILDVEGAVRNAGKMNVVVINKGKREGLMPGDILQIDKAGEVVRDRVKGQNVQLPDTQAGLLMVFRAFNKLSLALILQTNITINPGDKVKNP